MKLSVQTWITIAALVILVALAGLVLVASPVPRGTPAWHDVDAPAWAK